MFTKEYHWYLARTKANHEFTIINRLTKSTIECFCPSRTEIRYRKKGKASVHIPLFSLYVFVRVSNKEYETVLYDKSVFGFVSCAGIPEVIKEDQIEALKNLCHQINGYEITGLRFKKGEDIIIQAGSFRGMRGEIVSIRGKRKVLVRIPCIEYGILFNTLDLVTVGG
ncbi:MAG: UpxY family transcription antiterminator [Bacteroidales bacterium]|nr:UpxY family transcription antiterminator [Bacteroidales bacterium]